LNLAFGRKRCSIILRKCNNEKYMYHMFIRLLPAGYGAPWL
jgi:hypothetical protein